MLKVAVFGSYMVNPMPGFLKAKLEAFIASHPALAAKAEAEGWTTLVTDSKGVAAVAAGREKSRVFVAKDEDGKDAWSKRTAKMVKAADALFALTTGKEGVDNAETAYAVEAFRRDPSKPVQVIRI